MRGEERGEIRQVERQRGPRIRGHRQLHDVAAAAGATLVGVNARDLATLEVDPDRFAAVRQALPGGTVLVAESGIHDRAGVEAAADAGADAVLVGETLVNARDPAAAVRDLLGVPTRTGGAHG